MDNYIVVEDALGPSTPGHIDCWAKLLAPDKIMILEVPPDGYYYEYLEDAADYFEDQISSYGTPYEVYRVYAPNGEPYVNSLILNNKVLIPFEESEWNDEAVASYENAMPGYEIIGFYENPWYGWNTLDALHCRTMGIPDRGMLYIEHTPLLGYQRSLRGFDINARIVPYSGQSLTAGSPEVIWKVENGEWNSLQMQSTGNYNYTATIPLQEIGQTVSYYIHAEDESGRNENHPYIGAADPHSFIVEEPYYVPGDFNGDGRVIGSDVTALVNYFRTGVVPQNTYEINGFYPAGDANGDCRMIGSDVTYLVTYFRGIHSEIRFCSLYPPT